MRVPAHLQDDHDRTIRILEARGIAVHESQYDHLDKVSRIMRENDRQLATIANLWDNIITALRRFASCWRDVGKGWVLTVTPRTDTEPARVSAHLLTRADTLAIRADALSRGNEHARKLI